MGQYHLYRGNELLTRGGVVLGYDLAVGLDPWPSAGYGLSLEFIDWSYYNAGTTLDGHQITADSNGAEGGGSVRIANSGTGLRAAIQFVPMTQASYDVMGFYDMAAGNNMTYSFLKYGFECAYDLIWIIVGRQEITLGNAYHFVPDETVLTLELWDDSVRWLKDGEEIYRELEPAPADQYFPGYKFYNAGSSFRDAKIGAQVVAPR